MDLNGKQKTALWLGVALVVASGMFPPWKDAAGMPCHYAPIFSPPATPGNPVDVDFSRLLVTWVMAVAITIGMVLTGKETKGKDGDGGQAHPHPKTAGHETASTSDSHADAKVKPLIFHFPANAVGDLLVESKDDPDYWDFLAEAKGEQSAPKGQRLQLEIKKDAPCDLSFLQSLGNKESRRAIVSIDLSDSEIDDENLKHLQCLPNLEELDLSNTSITDKGLERLVLVSSLKKVWLDGTEVTPQSINTLVSIGGLNKISLNETKISEDDVQSLKLRLPQCEVSVVTLD